ncbi:MAG: glucosaminidase domain-containing protein [Bacilli bacterium]|nr:glucosaminidase domain-containing protein [Bacilli bacterium]
MKKQVVKLLINGSILTLLTTPYVFANIKLEKNSKMKFGKFDYNKEQLYAEENIIIEPKNVNLTTNVNTLFSYISLVDYYSNVFGLDNKMVLDKISEYTNNFNSEKFINDNEIYDYGISFDSKEQSIIYFIKDIDMNYSKYGFDESVFVDSDYVPTMECEEMVEKYSEIFGIDKRISMSIIYTESHYTLSSKNFNERNNPAGAGYTYYGNLEEGIIYHIINLKNNYSNYSLDNISFYSEAQSKYCPDNDGSWITLNEYYYQVLTEDYYYYLNLRIEDEKVLTR